MTIFLLDVRGGLFRNVGLSAYEVVSETKATFKVKKIADLLGATYKDTIRKNSDKWFSDFDEAVEETRKAQIDNIESERQSWQREIDRLDDFDKKVSEIRAQKQGE